MKQVTRIFYQVLLGASLIFSAANAQEAAPSARELANQLSRNLQDQSSLVRLKMSIKPKSGAETVLQLQAKSLRTANSTDLIYQVLWPKERKGESFLLRKSGSGAVSGSVLTPPNSLSSLKASQMKDSALGSDLCYDDLVEDFFGWSNQVIVGSESLGGADCWLLDSKPGKGDHSNYSRVRTWVDSKRMVSLRVEKFNSSDNIVKRIDTTKVAKDDTGKYVASSFSLFRSGKDSVTEIEGSSSKHNVTYTSTDFTPEALRSLK